MVCWLSQRQRQYGGMCNSVESCADRVLKMALLCVALHRDVRIWYVVSVHS